MKKMKKILAFVMAMAMVLGLSVTAMANGANPTPDVKTENVSGTDNDEGYIAVNGISAEKKDGVSPVKVYAYKIVEPEYDATTGYFTSKYKGLVSSLNGADGYLDRTKLIDVTVLADLKKNMKPNANTTEWTIDDTTFKGSIVEMILQGDGSYKANVKVGSYLVLVQGADAKTYSPIVVSASYVVKDNDSAIESDTLNIENGVSWVKVSDKPAIEKKAETTNSDKISANVDDVISYTVTVKNIPAYDGAHPVFKVTDKLSDGLDLEKGSASDFANSVVVKAGETVLKLNTDYTVTINQTNTREFTVDFVVDDKYTLKTDSVDYTSQTLTIAYQAKVNSNAKMNSLANDNDAKLTFSKDSNVDGDEGEVKDKTYNYTFDLSGNVTGDNKNSMVNKVGKETASSTDSVALAEAEFTLYTQYDGDSKKCSVPYNTTLIPNGIVTSGDGTDNKPVKGALVIRGLAAGTYYLQETKAPAGYSINADVYQIVINAVYYKATDTDIPADKEIGQLKSWTVTVKNLNDSSDTGKEASFNLAGGTTSTTINVEIPNTHLSSLPSTGGIGTTIFTIGGCAIMIVAAGLFFASRRKSAK